MKILHKDTYLSMIRNAEGARMFRNLWADVDGERIDIIKDGLISCGFFVSSILAHFKLAAAPHATISGTLADMERSGWQQVGLEALAPGCVLVWERAAQAGGEEHLHMGFYLDEGHAMSHSDKARAPAVHELNFSGRKIIAAYTHPFLQ